MIEIYKDYKITIKQDENAESPNEWGDDAIFLVYDHRQFQVDRKGFKPSEIFEYLSYPPKPKFTALVDKGIFNNVDDPEEYANNKIEEWENGKNFPDFSDYYIFGVDAYIHSRVALSLASKTNFPDRRWDISTTGFILVSKSKEDFDFELQRKSKEELKDKTDEEIAEHYTQGLIDTWNQYLDGEVYHFKIEKPIVYVKILKDNLSNLDSYSYQDIIDGGEEEIEYEEVDSCGGNYIDEDDLLKECKETIDKILETNE